ncbi:hypothetical protein MBAV_005257 [Candidatus Magnetobacterium bavaricum]|uniref:Uncharacterized protein n=1 Tax=Candidatus Magnetobacterium bavaricum TaxID=29290 RepID=A0A0F3GKV0_9BACT|nr:hypothetical protein MBAV_005257 [Candidatus Magnetobacterium bavaricum]
MRKSIVTMKYKVAPQSTVVAGFKPPLYLHNMPLLLCFSNVTTLQWSATVICCCFKITLSSRLCGWQGGVPPPLYSG